MTNGSLIWGLLLAASLVATGCAEDVSDAADDSADSAFTVENVATYRLVRVEAGVDYPTDRPLPAELENKRILLVRSSGGYQGRIAIPKDATLLAPKAGEDYPTDAPNPFRPGTRILAIGAQRVPLRLELARAGVEFPTDAPPPEPRPVVWAISAQVRVPVAKIARIEEAVAGVDFPTDGPPNLDREFLVAVKRDGQRIKL